MVEPPPRVPTGPPTLEGGGTIINKEDSNMQLNTVTLSERQTKALEMIKQWKKGQTHTVTTEQRDVRKAAAAVGLRYIKKFQVHYIDIENAGAVKEYRATTGQGPNNPAVMNEVHTDIFNVDYNTKTKKVKLRTPLFKDEAVEAFYFRGSRQFKSKAGYYRYMTSVLKLAAPKPSAAPYDKAFRSLDLDKVIEIDGVVL